MMISTFPILNPNGIGRISFFVHLFWNQDSKITQNTPGQIYGQRLMWQSQRDDVAKLTADMVQSVGAGQQATSIGKVNGLDWAADTHETTRVVQAARDGFSDDLLYTGVIVSTSSTFEWPVTSVLGL